MEIKSIIKDNGYSVVPYSSPMVLVVETMTVSVLCDSFYQESNDERQW